jgi:hypothetical protein
MVSICAGGPQDFRDFGLMAPFGMGEGPYPA